MRVLLFVLTMGSTFLSSAQHLTYPEWQMQSARDMRLMPRFDGRQKNPEQLASDSAFLAQTLAVEPDRTKAAEHMAQLGFQLLGEGNMVQAMYRFNQAYLLDPKEPEVFRGYGAFFMALDRSTDAGQEYVNGLMIDSTNVPLMVDFAAAFLAEQNQMKGKDPEKADQLLDGAIRLLDRARTFDPQNAEAAFKLAVCHAVKGECSAAWRYHDMAKTLGSTSITPEFKAQLQLDCPRIVPK